MDTGQWAFTVIPKTGTLFKDRNGPVRHIRYIRDESLSCADGKVAEIADCCGDRPLTKSGEGEWPNWEFEGIKCFDCGRTVYGDPDDKETVEEWNKGEDHS